MVDLTGALQTCRLKYKKQAMQATMGKKKQGTLSWWDNVRDLFSEQRGNLTDQRVSTLGHQDLSAPMQDKSR